MHVGIIRWGHYNGQCVSIFRSFISPRNIPAWSYISHRRRKDDREIVTISGEIHTRTTNVHRASKNPIDFTEKEKERKEEGAEKCPPEVHPLPCLYGKHSLFLSFGSPG